MLPGDGQRADVTGPAVMTPAGPATGDHRAGVPAGWAVPVWHYGDEPGRAPSSLPLAGAVDVAIEDALAALGETRAPAAPSVHQLRSEHHQRRPEARVQAWLFELVMAWCPPVDLRLAFFEELRRRCYRLYDQTVAYATVEALVSAVSRAIQQVVDRGAGPDADPLDAGPLLAVEAFLRLLRHDIEVFEGVNRGSDSAVIAGLGRAVATADEVIGQLTPGPGAGPAQPGGPDQALAQRLGAKAQTFKAVYEGMAVAATALWEHEQVVRACYDRAGGEDTRPGAPEGDGAAGDLPAVRRRLEGARRHLAGEIARLGSGRGGGMQGDPLDDEERSYVSRLTSWERVLETAGRSLTDETGFLVFADVRVRYCFPFAVPLPAGSLERWDPNLAPRLPGVEPVATSGELGPPGDGGLAAALAKGYAVLAADGREAEVSTAALRLSEFWRGAGDGLFGGVRVDLPALVPEDDPARRWAVWIELSRLDNHCLCLERTLRNPTPHELYGAMRGIGHYVSHRTFRYRWAPPGPPGQEASSPAPAGWRSVDDFAQDVIGVTAGVLAAGADDSTQPWSSSQPWSTGRHPTGGGDRPGGYLKGHFHEVVVVTTSEPLGTGRDEIAATLRRRYGGKLFCTSLHRVAGALEEWLRYPVMDSPEDPRIAHFEFGYDEDWVATMGDTTVFGVVGNPSWQTGAYVEAAQFAASWSPTLMMWNREVMRALRPRPTGVGPVGSGLRRAEGSARRLVLGRPEPKFVPSSSELRQLEGRVQRYIASVHSEELCRLHTHRRFLDRLLAASGTTGIEEDLQRQLRSVEARRDWEEQSAKEEVDNERNRLLAALTVFGVLNLSTVFAFLDVGSSHGLLVEKSRIVAALCVQAALFVVVFAWVVRVYRRRSTVPRPPEPGPAGADERRAPVASHRAR